MNTHKNARLTFIRRQEMVHDIVEQGMTPVMAAAAHGVSAPTARKWLGRFLAQGPAGLRDASSRPCVSPRTIAPERALAVIELRRRRLTQARIAFTQMKPNERRGSAIAFLRATVAYFASLGVTVRRILTDNGSAFRSKRFKRACELLGLKHSFTRPYRPQTNGKAERFIQSALREWAYGIAYGRSSERTTMLKRWTHHYNWHRPHQGIGGAAPISRLRRSRNNLLTLHN